MTARVLKELEGLMRISNNEFGVEGVRKRISRGDLTISPRLHPEELDAYAQRIQHDGNFYDKGRFVFVRNDPNVQAVLQMVFP